MGSHTKSYKSSDPGVPIQSLYIRTNRDVLLTQNVSLGCLCSTLLTIVTRFETKMSRFVSIFGLAKTF